MCYGYLAEYGFVFIGFRLVPDCVPHPAHGICGRDREETGTQPVSARILPIILLETERMVRPAARGSGVQ